MPVLFVFYVCLGGFATLFEFVGLLCGWLLAGCYAGWAMWGWCLILFGCLAGFFGLCCLAAVGFCCCGVGFGACSVFRRVVAGVVRALSLGWVDCSLFVLLLVGLIAVVISLTGCKLLCVGCAHCLWFSFRLCAGRLVWCWLPGYELGLPVWLGVWAIV